MNEIFYAIFGIRWGNFFYGKFDFFEEGQPTSVSFDYNKVREKIDSGKNLIGFYHTHPNMMAYMSDTDCKTMEAWVNSEGKNLLCFIRGDSYRFPHLNIYVCSPTQSVFYPDLYCIIVNKRIFGFYL